MKPLGGCLFTPETVPRPFCYNGFPFESPIEKLRAWFENCASEVWHDIWRALLQNGSGTSHRHSHCANRHIKLNISVPLSTYFCQKGPRENSRRFDPQFLSTNHTYVCTMSWQLPFGGIAAINNNPHSLQHTTHFVADDKPESTFTEWFGHAQAPDWRIPTIFPKFRDLVPYVPQSLCSPVSM